MISSVVHDEHSGCTYWSTTRSRSPTSRLHPFRSGLDNQRAVSSRAPSCRTAATSTSTTGRPSRSWRWRPSLLQRHLRDGGEAGRYPTANRSTSPSCPSTSGSSTTPRTLRSPRRGRWARAGSPTSAWTRPTPPRWQSSAASWRGRGAGGHTLRDGGTQTVRRRGPSTRGGSPLPDCHRPEEGVAETPSCSAVRCRSATPRSHSLGDQVLPRASARTPLDMAVNVLRVNPPRGGGASRPRKHAGSTRTPESPRGQQWVEPARPGCRPERACQLHQAADRPACRLAAGWKYASRDPPPPR